MKSGSKPDIFYVGYYVDEKYFNEIVRLEINNMSAARQSLETGLLGAFAEIKDVSVKALTYVPDSALIDIPEESSINGLSIDHISIKKGSISSCIKAAWKFWKYLKKEVPSGSAVLMYAINPVFMIPLWIAKNTKSLKLTTICSEVPAFRRYRSSLPMKLKKTVQTFFNNRFDNYILLTEAMKEVVNVGNKPYMVMEGIASDIKCRIVDSERKNIVMYAGGLHPDNNLMLLIEACEKASFVDECWICGSGPQEGALKLRIADSPKIKMLGRLSHKDVVEREKVVKVLVNLRDPSNVLTRYSFPSKIIEYLSSGAQVISTKLEGIPDEYFRHVHPLNSVTSDDLAEILDRCMSLSTEESQRRANEALDFLKSQKTAQVQSRRIIDFICKN